MKLDRLFTTVTLAQMQELLRAVAGQVESGFSLADAVQVSGDISRLGPDGDLLIEPFVALHGATIPFILDASRAGAGVEAIFITAPPLTDWLEQHLVSLGTPVPVKVLRAE
jgi:hypothetical protein